METSWDVGTLLSHLPSTHYSQIHLHDDGDVPGDGGGDGDHDSEAGEMGGGGDDAHV